MIGKKTPIKEAKHNIRLLIIATILTIGLSLLFFIISAISGTGEKKTTKKDDDTKFETEQPIVLFNPNKNETTVPRGETFPTVG